MNTFVSFLFLFSFNRQRNPLVHTHTHTDVVIVAAVTKTPASTAAALLSRAVWAPVKHKTPNVCRRCSEPRGRTTARLHRASLNTPHLTPNGSLCGQKLLGFFFSLLLLPLGFRRGASLYQRVHLLRKSLNTHDVTAAFFHADGFENEERGNDCEWAGFHSKCFWHEANFNTRGRYRFQNGSLFFVFVFFVTNVSKPNLSNNKNSLLELRHKTFVCFFSRRFISEFGTRT